VANILINNGINNSSLNSISNFIGIIFALVIIYKIAKVIYTSKKLNINTFCQNTFIHVKIIILFEITFFFDYRRTL